MGKLPHAATAQHGSELTPPQLSNCGGQNAPGPRPVHWASLVHGRRKPPSESYSAHRVSPARVGMQKQLGFPLQGAVQTLVRSAHLPIPVTHCPSAQIPPHSLPAGHSVRGTQRQVPSGWQTLPALPQARSCCAGSMTQVPGVSGNSWQMSQAAHAGSQAHEPQSIVFWQLLVTRPHLPLQV